METLRKNLSDTVNELNKLIVMARSEEEAVRLRKMRRIYFTLWEEVIEQEIDNRTKQFKTAITRLKKARDAAIKAQEDVKQIPKAIRMAVSAARAVDRIVKIAGLISGF